MTETTATAEMLLSQTKNRYPGKCFTCREHVSAYTGSATQVDGKWRVSCPAHTIYTLEGPGIQGTGPVVRVELTATGAEIAHRQNWKSLEEVA